MKRTLPLLAFSIVAWSTIACGGSSSLVSTVSLHITNLDKRGIRSVIAEAAVGVISGFGTESYILGLDAMLNHLPGGREQHRSL